MEDLPTQVAIDILSRLPVKTVIHCKCVCKKWLKLLSKSEFIKLHLSRLPACLMFHHFIGAEVCSNGLGILKLVEIEDEIDHHRLHHDPVMSLDLGRLLKTSQSTVRKLPVGSVNGLICLREFGCGSDNTYILNPITREYMMLPRHHFFIDFSGTVMVVYGFGVGSLTGEYKVIRTMLMHIPPNTESSRPNISQAEVYTLGTGQWRSLGHVPFWLEGYVGPFLNGCVHWVVRDPDSREKLCAFDVDKETFQLFPSPPFDAKKERKINSHSLGVLNGCLSQCDSRYTDVTIWVMKEYGIKKSWHKMVMIRQSLCPKLLMFEPICLIEVFKDGGILMVHYEEKLLAYYPKTNTVQDIRLFDGHFVGVKYRPSFLKLKDFESQRVRVL